MSEYKHVEKPFLTQLEALGWIVIDQGPQIPSDPILSLRSSFKEVILRKEAIQQIIAINTNEDGNTWLRQKQVEDLLEELERQPIDKLLEVNKSIFEQLVDNYPRVDRNEITGEVNPPVKLIDFDHPENNSFYAINQFKIDTPGGTKTCIIPDIVLFVNGLPMVVVECKDLNDFSGDAMYEAYQQLKRYSDQRTPDYKEGEEKLFYWNQFNIITTGEEAKLGTISSSQKHFAFWKDIYPEEYQEFAPPLGKVRPQETLIQGVLPPSTLLNLIRHCILFMELDTGQEVKIIARYQQFRAIHKIVRRLLTGESSDERSGVVWHTQGSGKSLTMVMLIRTIRSHPKLKDFKVLMVNDRTDLELQLGDTAQLTNEPVDKVENIASLKEKLGNATSNVVMVMMHKFQELKTELPRVISEALNFAADPVRKYSRLGIVNKSSKVLILIDEAHRTQSSDLGDNLFEAFPNATIIAFTGTPLIASHHKGKRTEKRFGTSIDVYHIKNAVQDGATVEILYEGRTGDSAIRNKGEFDAVFEDMVKEHTAEEVAAIKKRYGTYRDVLESEEMIGQKALDMVRHYVRNIFPNGFKAQVVATSILAAVRYKKALEKSIQQVVEELEREGGGEELIARIRKLQTHAIVTSQGTNEAAIITATRKESKEANAIENFKKPFNEEDDASFIAFLVVCDMLLTGFDAPIEQVMYLDKRMREHNLLQAIARVNRTAKGKTRGYIVDYVGVSDHLWEALEMYGSDRDKILESFQSIESEIPTLESRYNRLIQQFEKEGISEIADFVKQRTADEVLEFQVLERCIEAGRDIKFRATFDLNLKMLMESMDIILPNKAAGPYRIPVKCFAYIHAKMKHRYKDATLNISETGAKIRDLVNEYLIGLGVDSRIPPVELLSADFEREVGKNKSKKAMASEMEHAIKKHIKVSFNDDPALYEKLSEKLEDILKQYREDYNQQVIEFEKLRKELGEGRQTSSDGLSPVASLLLDNLVNHSRDQQSARESLRPHLPVLIKLLKEHIRREHFWDKAALRKELEAAIEELLILEDISGNFENTSALISSLMQLVQRRAKDIQSE